MFGKLAGNFAGNLAGGLTGGGAAEPSPFLTAYAKWFIDAYSASPRPHVPNAMSAVAAPANLFSAPRNLFTNTQWWSAFSSTKADNAAVAPDGTMSASSITGTGNWAVTPAVSNVLPAGTYTMACNVMRNTGSNQQFCFYTANTGSRGPARTATSAWQRFSYTFTLGSPSTTNVIGLGSIDGVTNGNILICDFELFSGSSDLGPSVPAGHLVLGVTGFDTRPSYSGGVLDVSSNGFGLVQLGATKTITTFTFQALVSKTALATGYSSMLSKVQNYLKFSLMNEFLTRPNSTFGDTNPVVGPVQGAGLWVALNKGYHAITLRYDGTYFDFWIDDVRMLRKAVSSGPVDIADLTFNLPGDTGFAAGNKYAGIMALWDSAITDAQVRQAVAENQARAALSSVTATTATRFLVAEGDSLTETSSPNCYPYVFGPNASPSLFGVDYAVSGDTIATLTARSAIVDGVLPVSRAGRRFIFTVLIGANDLLSLGNAPWLAAFAAYCDARRAAGWYVIIGTLLPRTSVGFNTARNVVNPTLRTWVGTHCDAVFDGAADATIGTDAAASNVTYYSDGTHLTTAGQVILEAVYRPVVNAA